MRVLLDECVNPRLRHAFSHHEVTTVSQARWLTLADAELLVLAHNRFEVLLTLDQGFAHQHDLRKLTFGIVILHVPRNTLQFYEPLFSEITSAIETVNPGQVVHVFSPEMRRTPI